MCELLGMSANVPTDICFSFSGLMQRGGRTGPHKDGWGITFYEGKGSRTFRDPHSSANSEIAKLVRNYPIKSEIVISHIRRASHGKVCLTNTHPFTREMWGQFWTFAHNGRLKGIKKKRLNNYHPVGTTDSEHAFCWILDKIREKYPNPPKSEKVLYTFINKLCKEIARSGSFNILLSDSKSIYAYCTTKLCWITRRAPFGKAKLLDEEMVVDFREVTTTKDVVTIIATQPLTGNEEWNNMQKGDMNIFKKGILIRQ